MEQAHRLAVPADWGTSSQKCKKYKFFSQNQASKQKFKIPLPKPLAGSAKKHSYEVSSLKHENWGTSSQKFENSQKRKKYQFFSQNRALKAKIQNSAS